MRTFDLIVEWVEEQDWLPDCWSCSSREPHVCGVISHCMHIPFIAIPFVRGGHTLNLRIYIPKSLNLVFFRWIVDNDGNSFMVGSECKGLGEPDFLSRLEIGLRAEVDSLTDAGYEFGLIDDHS